jgi:hypothetical protein
MAIAQPAAQTSRVFGRKSQTHLSFQITAAWGWFQPQAAIVNSLAFTYFGEVVGCAAAATAAGVSGVL